MEQIIWNDMKELYTRTDLWKKLYHKKILITGAYGMIGAYMVFFLIFLNEEKNAGINIYAVGRNIEKARKRFKDYFNKDYFHFVKNDFETLDGFRVFPDYIIHAASNANSQLYASNPVETTKPNILGIYSILEEARRQNVESIVYISSGTVFELPEHQPLNYEMCYSESKRMAECLCNCYYYEYNIPVKIVRPGHTYGPTMNIEEDRRVFSEFVSNVISRQDIEIKSDGQSKRAFSYIADVVFGIFLVLLSGQNGSSYNIADIKGLMTIKELAEIIVEICDSDVGIRFSARESGDNYIENKNVNNNIIDVEKISALGWECKYNVKEGFARTIQHFMNPKTVHTGGKTE